MKMFAVSRLEERVAFVAVTALVCALCGLARADADRVMNWRQYPVPHGTPATPRPADGEFLKVLPPLRALGAVGDEAKRSGVAVWWADYGQHIFSEQPPTDEDLARKGAIRTSAGEDEPLVLGLWGLRDAGKVTVEVLDPAFPVTIRRVEFAPRQVPGGYYDYTIKGGRIVGFPTYLPAANRGTVAAGANIAFWITVSVPPDAKPGTYCMKGRLALHETSKGIELPITVEVLPFELPRAKIAYGMYFRPSAKTLKNPRDRTPERLRFYWRDMARHGMTSMTLYNYTRVHDGEGNLDLDKAPVLGWLKDMIEDGLVTPDVPVMYLDGTGIEFDPNLQKILAAFKQEIAERDWPEFLFYGPDEPGVNDKSLAVFTALQPVRKHMRIISAISDHAASAYADLLDIYVVNAGCTSPDMGKLAADKNVELWNYTCHNRGQSNAPFQRYYAGIYTWALRLKGNFIWAYTEDYTREKGKYLPWAPIYCYVVPGDEGVLASVAWEARREGVEDYRLLTLLEEQIAKHPDDEASGEAQAWLAAIRGRVDWYLARDMPPSLYPWDGPELHPLCPGFEPADLSKIRAKAIDYLVRLTAGPAPAGKGPRIGADKKVVHYFMYWPDAKYCRENVLEMERLPFDGIAIWPTAEIDGKREKIWFRWFNPERIPEEMVADTIRDLKATEFTTFTDNFLQMSSQCGPLGAPSWWDDDAWEAISANMALAARIAKDCGLKGIMIDVEQYGAAESPYKYRFNYPYAHAEEKKLLGRGQIDKLHTWEAFAAGARRRGREIMRAMCEVYPDITVISIAGLHELAKRRIGDGQGFCPDEQLKGLASSDYGVLAPFADGLLEGAGPAATVVDGCEGAYAYTLNRRFVDARSDIEDALDVSAAPDLYEKRMKVAFGLMLDFDYHSRGWHTDPQRFARNHFTPIDFGNALYFGMLNSDRYVWVYSELDGAVFLENVHGYWQDPAEHAGSTVHEAYIAAMRGAREPRDLDTGRDSASAATAPIPESAAKLPGYGAGETFTPLLDKYELIADLPEEWLFYADEESLGQTRLDYTRVETDVSEWQPIRIGEFFQCQGYRFRGIAWYRCSFDVPKELEGRNLRLLFPGVSTQHVWVNGVWCDAGVESGVLCVSISPPPGLHRGRARFGEENTVVVPIMADGNAAGIYNKPVKLAVLKSEEQAE